MVPQDPTEKRLEEIGDGFTIEFLRSEIRRHPENADALTEFAGLLTKKGRYREGLEVDLRLAQLRPSDPIVHYNLACSYALLGQPEQAVEELRRALEFGYEDLDFLRRDPDLKSLHALPSFQRLLERLWK